MNWERVRAGEYLSEDGNWHVVGKGREWHLFVRLDDECEWGLCEFKCQSCKFPIPYTSMWVAKAVVDGLAAKLPADEILNSTRTQPAPVLRIGDIVRTTVTIKNGQGGVFFRKGYVGRVVEHLYDTKFVLEFPGVHFLFNYWADEVELVQRRRT